MTEPKFSYNPPPADHGVRDWAGQSAADDLEFHEEAVKHFQRRYDAAIAANPYVAPEIFAPLLRTKQAHQTAVDAIKCCRRSHDSPS